MKGKSENNYQTQEKHVKKQRHESEVERIEDGGAHEDELKKARKCTKLHAKIMID